MSTATGSRNLTQPIYAAVTVGLSTLGAAFALWQVIDGTVTGFDLALLMLFYWPTAIGVEAGMHRYFSHRAFRGSAFVTQLLGALGSMAAQGPVLFWVATHRKHHGATDKEGDPHSPWLHGQGFGGRMRGLWHAHIGWLFGTGSLDWARYVPDLLRRRDVFLAHRLYLFWLAFGLGVPALLGGMHTGSWQGAFHGLIWGGLARIFLLDHVTWTINSLGHTVGARPHVSKDRSGNLALLALPSCGGSWHNNHHAYPSSARNDHRFWQIDLSGLFIEGLALAGFVDQVNRPRPLREAQRISVPEELT